MSETTRRPMIALMAKAPRAGHAKTRLAAGIGEDAALAFWAACLADLGPAIRETVRGVADTVAVVPSLDDVEPVSALLGPGWSVVVQRRTGLGGAIVDAFAEAETRGADRAIAISGDNPTLPTHWLLTGLDTLRRHGAVLGPCPDGGYYLVGMRLRRRRPWVSRRPPVADRADRVFRTARLGGENARSTTARALDSEGFRAHVMEMWPDIDTAADLAYLAASLRGEQPRAPWTRQWLAAYAALVPVTGEGRAIEAAESPLAGNMRGSHPAERGPTT